jgi:hypothetical protein
MTLAPVHGPGLKKSGFKKAIFADGHRYTWTFDLDK